MYLVWWVVGARVPLRGTENSVDALTGVCENNAHPNMRGVWVPPHPLIQCCHVAFLSGVQTSAKNTLTFWFVFFEHVWNSANIEIRGAVLMIRRQLR